MQSAATVLVLAGVALAMLDWVAVGRGDKRLEYLAKPATMVPLIAAAMVLDPSDGTQRAWFVVALVLSLAGDVWLMLPERAVGPLDTFTFGLASFLLAHVAYIAGFVHAGEGESPLALLAVVLLPVVVAILKGAAPKGMAVPVSLYMAVILSMFVSASGAGLAFLGAALFVASDAMIGWTRFVREFPRQRLAIITTYHLAQVALVVSLAR